MLHLNLSNTRRHIHPQHQAQDEPGGVHSDSDEDDISAVNCLLNVQGADIYQEVICTHHDCLRLSEAVDFTHRSSIIFTVST